MTYGTIAPAREAHPDLEGSDQEREQEQEQPLLASDPDLWKPPVGFIWIEVGALTATPLMVINSSNSMQQFLQMSSSRALTAQSRPPHTP